MKNLKSIIVCAVLIGSCATSLQADDGDNDTGACYQTLKISGQTQCNVVERRFCIGNLFVKVRFVEGGVCE